jgi:hypothetical protein
MNASGVLIDQWRRPSLRKAALVTLALSACVPIASAQAATPSTASPSASGWANYPSAPAASGSFSISPDGKTVSGTLPPGFTKLNPPSDPDDPGMAQKIKNATNTSDLHTSPAPTLATTARTFATMARSHVRAHAADLPHSGCVSAQSVIGPTGIDYKGTMAGCASGVLWLHIYLNRYGTRWQDNDPHICGTSGGHVTSCSVPYTHYGGDPSCAIWYNYAHGVNTTTGGDSTAWQEHDPYAC